MGVFGTVTVNCPRCTHPCEIQTSGVDSYALADAPLEILAEIKDTRATCWECVESFGIEVISVARVVS